MNFQLLYGVLLFTLLHVSVWWSTNAQFIEGWTSRQAMLLCFALSIPTTALAFAASRLTYDALGGQLWSVRFVGFGLSYLVFPVLTWWFLGESMFTVKTMLCVFLSFLIIYIQIWW